MAAIATGGWEAVMSKATIGAVTAALAWFGAATAAEAQGIDVTITGPSRVNNDESNMNVTATVTGCLERPCERVRIVDFFPREGGEGTLLTIIGGPFHGGADHDLFPPDV